MAQSQQSTLPTKIFLKDYKKPEFKVEDFKLFFDLNEDYTIVKSQIQIEKTDLNCKNLILDGTGLELLSVTIDGKSLNSNQYQVTENHLTVPDVPDRFVFETIVKIKPQENTSLEGLYRSNNIFTTQCEAQGFRKITYFFDRPDVMTKYTVMIEADEKKYPVLLSNGDKISSKKLAMGRSQVVWHDPHKKPCYLFALVAGDLGLIKDTYTTGSGKKVELEIYAAHGQQSRCQHAMDSLIKSMKWDESRFGREYDLSTYMVVAIDDFNAGAMENKGLNIFNTRLVLADEKSATDADYFNIESVMAHEYFHNWTGNRVTLRDWFHLSLKEGLTVFRDQEFSMDHSSRAMIRIENVTDLRAGQFSEDAGPNAHPIRPESCYAVDNFFTSTIYEKGAEVIRMMQTMVGRPGFRKGMDLYFSRHDGQAVIIEDFAKAISDANNQDWEQFKFWYSQAGTPVVTVKENYDLSSKTYTLKLSQMCPPTPEQLEKKPFHIPLVMGLIDANGNEIEILNEKISKNSDGQNLIHLKGTEETYVFKNIHQRPTLSLNRGFSAPVHIHWDATDSDLLNILAHDSDEFNRWESGQKLALQSLQMLIAGFKKNEKLPVKESLLTAIEKVLQNTSLDNDLKAKILTLPEDSYISQLESEMNAKAFAYARETLETQIAQKFEKTWLSIYKDLHGKNVFSRNPKDFADRRLKNLALQYLSLLPGYDKLAYDQFSQAQIMTDQQSALTTLSHINSDYRTKAIEEFHDKWKNDFLVLNKWFAIQAQSSHPDTFDQVVKLWDHKDFNKKNPNRVYALLLRFGDNLVQFHNADKETYSFMAEKIIEMDKINPHVATRLAGSFDIWTKLPEQQKVKAHQALERMMQAILSKNTYEIVSKSLASK